MSRREDQQSLLPGRLVELFDLDLSEIPGETAIYRWCSSFQESGDVVWKGNTYTPLPIQASGFETVSKGTLPTPTLRMANAKLVPSAIINDIGDPLGAKVTRWRVHEKYLDGNSLANPNEHYPVDVFQVERKKTENQLFVEFELSSYLDKEGIRLPRRPVLRNACLQRYRVYDGSAFNYAEVTCPWLGQDAPTDEGPFFNENDESTTKDLDKCGKRLKSCRLRHDAAGLPIPGWFFPGAGRIR
tara:strand:+ start:1832 stop:2560 length:729 start_codon:yes stop_codon:yes gene_type:complete